MSGTPTPRVRDLPFRIVHYDGKAPPGTEIFSTLGLSDYELSDDGARIELMMIAPARLTAGTIPPILVSAGELPIEVDDVPQCRRHVPVDRRAPRGVADGLPVRRAPAVPAAGAQPVRHRRRPGRDRGVFLWLIPVYEQEADFVDAEGWEAFERLMWELDVDPTDFTREPWID